LGPLVDPTPRPLPARIRIRGIHVELEPLHTRHAAELWDAAQGAGDSWSYMGYGPFASQAEMTIFVAGFASTHDPMAWAVRPVATGVVSGWLTLMEIQPRYAAIELGHIWFAPRMQRTRAATEAMFLLLRLAADELGYRRLVWKCNALNAPSRRAAAPWSAADKRATGCGASPRSARRSPCSPIRPSSPSAPGPSSRCR